MKAKQKKRQAPLPARAGASSSSVPAPAGKALLEGTSQIASLNRLRGLRMKTAGGNY